MNKSATIQTKINSDSSNPNEETRKVIEESRKGININRHDKLGDYFSNIEKDVVSL